MSWHRRVRVAASLTAILGLGACGGGSPSTPRAGGDRSAPAAHPSHHAYVAPPFRHPLPGMPPVIGNDVYSQDRAGMLAPRVRHDPSYLYVPDSQG